MKNPGCTNPIAVLVAVLLTAAPASAGELPHHLVHKRVRIGLGDPPDRILIGRVVGVGSASVLVERETGGPLVDVPNASIAWIDLSRIHSKAGTYAGRGALIGAAAVALPLAIGVASARGDCGEWPCGAVLVVGLYPASLAAATGALVGAAIGSRHRTETWHTFWPARKVGVSMMPVRQGWAASVSVRF